MKRVQGLTAIAVTASVGLTALFAPVAASASAEGRRNTAYALGAAALLLLLTQNNHHHDRYRDDYRYNDGYQYRDGYRNGDGYRYRDDNRSDRGYRRDR